MRDWKGFLRERLNLEGVRRHRDERMLNELADHLADLYDEALIRGATPEEAEALVLHELGDMDAAASELSRSQPLEPGARASQWIEGREDVARRGGGRLTVLADALRDLRLACRAIGQRPLFAGIVIVVLALGIGATTAIFTLADAIVLRPLPFDDAERLVSISHAAPGRGLDDVGQCAAWHLTYEDENRVFEEVGMYSSGSVAVTGVGDPASLRALFATSGVFRALRLEPVVGRGFTREDEAPGAPQVVLLSAGYWETRFGADPAVIGQTLRVNGVTREVVGVLPPELAGLEQAPSLILPLRFDRSTVFVGNIGFGAVARLDEGVTLEQAQADLARMLPLAWEKFPGGPVSSSSDPAAYTAVLEPLKDRLVGSVANLLWILLGGVGVVLLIACANVANLFLVRAEGKETEMAVRTAMGASRYRIGWEYMRESLLLGVLGGAAGLALAFGGLRILVATGPAELPRLQNLSLSSTVLLFTAVVSVGTGLLFGLVPGLRHGRGGLVNALKQGGTRGLGGPAQNRARNILAIGQMALALVLLVASGLMLRSMQSLRDVDPGFVTPEEVLALRISIPGSEIGDLEETALAFERIARRLEEVPGVTSVAMATRIPMDGSGNVNPFYVDGIPAPGGGSPSRRHNWIGEGYFEGLGIPLLAGRSFSWDEIHSRFPGAIVSESLAREYWGSPQAAIGGRVAARPDPPRWHEVVGVAADVRYQGVNQDPPLMVYWPQVTRAFWEGWAPDSVQTWRGMGYAIRSGRVGTPGLVDDVREAIWEVAPNSPVRRVRPLSDLMAQSVAQTSFTMVLLTVASAAALLLGLIGVYGVISYAVSQRTRELGVRLALGARAEDIKRMVLRQGLLLSLAGVAIGVVLAAGLTRFMAGLLFGVGVTDPLTYLVVAAGLTAVALGASYLPARRAGRVDPIVALSAE
jgi:predicted permease